MMAPQNTHLNSDDDLADHTTTDSANCDHSQRMMSLIDDVVDATLTTELMSARKRKNSMNIQSVADDLNKLRGKVTESAECARD